MKLPVVYVKFEDPATQHGWQPLIDVQNGSFSICEAIGYLVAEHDDRIVIAMLVNHTDEDANCVATIPKQAILTKRLINLDTS